MNKKQQIWTITFSLMASTMALIAQFKIQSYFPNTKFVFLYPVIFIISWLDFPSACACILYTATTVFAYSYKLNSESINLLRILVYSVSTFSIAWLIHFTKVREQLFLKRVSEKSRLLYSIVENMQDSFILVDKDWVISLVNRNHEKNMRAKKSEHLGKKIWDAFPISDYQSSKYWIELEKVKSQGKPVEFEEYFAPLKIWTEVRANKTEDGGVAIFYRDITKRKLQEECLASNEKRLRALADSMPQIVFNSNQYGRVQYLNKRWEEYTGDGLTSIHKIDLLKSIHPEDRNEVLINWKRSIRLGTKFCVECRLKNSSGQWRWHLVRSLPIFYEDGNIESWSGTSTDIHDLKSARELAKANEEKFENIANNIPQIAWMSDEKGKITWYNQRWFDYTGFKEMDPNPQWRKSLHPTHAERVLNNFHTHLLAGKPWEETHLIKNIEEQYRWFLTRAIPIRNDEGHIVRWFGTCTDIEDRKQLSDQIEEQKKELESALIIRDEFLSIASHELKTPLTSLKLHCQLYRKSMGLGKPEYFTVQKITGLCNQIDKQVGKLNRLVDDMLDVSRIRTGKLTLKPQSFDLRELVQEVLSILSDQFKTSGCPLPEVICSDKNLLVNWDRIRMEQVMMNLLTNTIRYGEGKKVLLTVQKNEDGIFIIVKDNGIGIADENVDKIFYRFEKIKNPKEDVGLGLGLFISKQIVEAHGGSIWVESKLGKGSEFKILIPCQ